MEVRNLRSFERLKTLTLHGNPFSEHKHYREVILHFIPHIRKLDFTGVTAEQRDKVALFENVFRSKLESFEDVEEGF